MKVDEKIVDFLVEKLIRRKETVMAVFDKSISLTKAAQSVENIMEEKAFFAFTLVSKLPLTSEFCYFCIQKLKGQINCSECEYGKEHGRCHNQNSDWMKIRESYNQLKKTIEELYYKGETYEDDIPRFKVGDYIKATKEPNGDKSWSKSTHKVVEVTDSGFAFLYGIGHRNYKYEKTWKGAKEWGFVVVDKPKVEVKKYAEERFKVGDVWEVSRPPTTWKVKIKKIDDENIYGDFVCKGEYGFTYKDSSLLIESIHSSLRIWGDLE
jgi:hypothetical protein